MVTVEPASAAPVRAGVPVLLGLVAVKVGAVGAAVSTTMASTELAELVLPALSVALAVNEWLPSANVDTVSVNTPPESAVAWPSAVLPL